MSPKMSFATQYTALFVSRHFVAKKIVATRNATTTYDLCRQKRETRHISSLSDRMPSRESIALGYPSILSIPKIL